MAHADFAAEHPLTPVDLRWYAGVTQFGYSLWTQHVTAALGARTTGVLAAAVAAAALAVLLRRGGALRLLPAALAGASTVSANLASGRIAWSVGLAVGLLAVVALPRLLPAALLALLAGAASPVAGLFTGLAGTALLLTGRRSAGLALAGGAAAALAVTGVVFGQGGWNSMSRLTTWTALVTVLVVGLAVPSRVVRVGAVLTAAGVVSAYAVHTPVGLNAARLPAVLAVPLVVAFAPLRPALVGLVAAGLAVVSSPLRVVDLAGRGDPVTTQAYFAPLVAELQRRPLTGRVEVVPTRDYWESVHVASAAPLARGWLRQQDTERNPLFFDGGLTPRTYEDWLRDTGVQYVALPGGPLSWVGRAEAGLVRAGLPYLTEVWRAGAWRLYEVDGAPSLAEGARVVRSTATQVHLQVDAPRDVLVRVQPTRWLTLDGPGCLEPDGRWVRLRARQAGTYVVGSALQTGTAGC